ncbi:MAG: PAS domain S-box protein [Planctomycetota bacterium]
MNNMLSEFRRVERTLQRLTIIAEQLNEGVALVDLNGIIHFANPAMVKMHGYLSGKDLISKKINALHTEDQMKTVIFPMIEAVKRKGQVQRNSEHLRSDGALFPTQTKMILLKNETDKTVGIIIFVIDITQYIQRENLLARQISESNIANRQLQEKLFECQQVEEQTREHQTQLEQQLDKRQQAEKELQRCCDQLQGQAEDLTAQLSTTEDRLQQQLDKYGQAEERFNQQASELNSINENLQHQVSQRQQTIEQLQQQLEDKKAELSEAGEQLQQQLNERQQLEEQTRSTVRGIPPGML